MAQELPRFCPRCGTPTTSGYTICARCGLNLLRSPSQPPQLQPQQQPQPPVQIQQLPPQQQLYRTTGSNVGNSTMNNAGPTFRTTTSPRRRGPGRAVWIGIVLLLIVVIGAVAYLALSFSGVHVPGSGVVANNTQSAITTTTLNETVTYAGVNVTILSAQQAQNFLDDPNSSTDGMVRLNVQEQNPTQVKVSWLYNDIASLVLPGGKTVAPTYVKATVGIAPGATQKSMLDFAVPTTDKLSQLTLRLGSASEAQLAIPLTSHANLGKYAPTTVKPGGQMQYLGLNWTLVSATAQYSVAGQQASKNMRYVVATISVDNTLSQEAIPGSAFNYIQLQAGNQTYTPVDTTLPVSFAAGETGKTGTVTFLVPQQSNALTLVLVSQNQSGATEATTNFQLS